MTVNNSSFLCRLLKLLQLKVVFVPLPLNLAWPALTSRMGGGIDGSVSIPGLGSSFLYIFDLLFLIYSDLNYLSFIIYDLLLSCRGLPCSSDSEESTCNVGDLGLIPGSGRSPGEGNGNPLQYSCLENSMDGRAWL